MKDVSADRLPSTIGLTQVRYVESNKSLAIVDETLA
jgi:hypothetical protein